MKYDLGAKAIKHTCLVALKRKDQSPHILALECR
jgi:hypothetical protein